MVSTEIRKRTEPPYWVKILSGSVGSTLTALVVTPLEVVKVRVQSQPVGYHSLPSNVSLCSRGCGTFVLNNGLGDCLLPKSAVPWFDSKGELKEKAHVSEKTKGTMSMLRRIFTKEGFSGLYAGIQPTLIMGIPNTVLYFLCYEEVSGILKHATDSPWMPALAGASARFVASVSTAPLELIRTRQASRVGAAEPALGMVTEFQNMIRAEGFLSMYKGLSPTLFRDVPFSAVYWLCIERLREMWRGSQGIEQVSVWQQAGQALFNGSVSGMIAAACTTPLDVVKTRRQIDPPYFSVDSAVCDHKGAVVYNAKSSDLQSSGTLQMMRNIVQNEGVPGLWKGNEARMIKVAPACAIMISSYELGKRLFSEKWT